ncbi:MAG TPA: four helix bundle protein [Chitinophagales bacterium]|nr:four helix bundle protein [Chitinophagales bacterium]HNE46521.1 four helix bundle protein [Chitinophagales bacterium]HNK97256.1 four helix bundle protein [Chitinophagales bacterium]
MAVWLEARKVSQDIYLLTKKAEFSEDPKLRWQMRGSSGSIMDNIAEGFSRGGTKEFIQFLRIAKGSSGELISQLHRCNDRNWISNNDFVTLCAKTQKITGMLQSLIQYLQSTTRKGPTHQ